MNTHQSWQVVATQFRISSLVLVGGVVLAAALTAYAQSWEVLSPTSTFAPAGAGPMLIDPLPADPNTPGIFLADRANPANIYRLIPAAGFNSFESEPVDSSTIKPVWSLGYVANDGTPHGTLYAVGQSRVILGKQNYGVWTVRSGPVPDAAGTWSWSEESWGLNSKADAEALGFTSDAKGNAFVCGWATANTKGDNNRHWVVRRKTPGGSFATVSNIKTSANVGATAKAMCALPGDGISPTVVYAVGHIGYRWNVMRSVQSGADQSWSSVGFSPTAYSMSVATDVACDSAGNVYVTGYYYWGYNFGCIIQKWDPIGNNWVTLLDNSSDLPTRDWRIAVDPAGRVTLTGTISARDGSGSRWIIVRPVDPQSSTSWQSAYANPLAHPFANNVGSYGNAIVADASGNVFVSGSGVTWNGISGAGLLRMVP